MGNSESKTEYNINYAKEKLKRIPLDVQKEKYEEIKEAATATGETVNGYIKKAIASYPELLESFVITLFLNKDISFHSEIFAKLEDELLKHSDNMTGFVRSGNTKGEYKLSLRFKNKNESVYKITQNFCDILSDFDIEFDYSQITISPNSEKPL